MTGLFDDVVTIKEQVEELQREIRARHIVYPKLVASGKLAQRTSDRRILVLEATVKALKAMDAQ